MPIFFQHPINDTTRLGIWKIEETEEFFKANVPLHRDVTHPHKRLQHLAGRFLLQYLFPDFPYELVKIADTRKPYLPNEQYHFSISHCGDYAAAIVSKDKRVGVDIEIPVEKIIRVKEKFLSDQELSSIIRHLRSPIGYPTFSFGHPPSAIHQPFSANDRQLLTLLWSAKEAVFKWYGDGGVDFREHIHLMGRDENSQIISANFNKTNTPLSIHYRLFDHLVLAWTFS
jgi:phosphopantetheinyl transferase